MTQLNTVLIVGGTGFLGLHLISEFYQLNPRPKIHIMDIKPLPPVSKTFYSFDPDQITVHQGDLTSPEEMSKILSIVKPDIIVHSASPIHGQSKDINFKVNVEGTRNLIDCAKEHKVPGLVYTSSAGVVFNGGNLYGVDETWPYPAKPMDVYNHTKQLAEVMVKNANSKTFKTIALRPSGIFGPGDRQMIPSLRDLGRQNRHKYQLGDNLNLYDVTYVGNVAYAHVLAAEKILDSTKSETVAGQIFTITNDSPIFFWSVGRAIWRADGKFIDKPVHIPVSVALVIAYLSVFFCGILSKQATLTPFRVRTSCATRYYNIDKAKTLLGYKPKTSIEQGIQNTLDAMDEAEATQ